MLLATWPVFAGQPQHDQASVTASGNIHIVAVMVEFQRDDNRFTSGDGTFNPDFWTVMILPIDPLPHDRGYFEAHLLFAKNYFERVSNGSAERPPTEVLTEIVTLQQEMAAYSPLGEDGKENEIKLAFLARDVWQEADRQGMLSGRTPGPGSHDLTSSSRRGLVREPGAGGNNADQDPAGYTIRISVPYFVKPSAGDPGFWRI